MFTIDTSKPVMATGATGCVAGWVVKGLLEAGAIVRAPVRNRDNGDKIKHLLDIAGEAPGQLKLLKADLLEPDSYAEATEGCGVVFHTASPFTIDVKDPQKELIDPAVNGTCNVLEQANKTESVERVVVNPSLVTGPALQGKPTSESFNLVRQMGEGTMKAGAPRLGFGVIDVRDLAQADLAAGFLPEANGRHIISAHESDVFSMSQELTEKIGGYLRPARALPKWLIWLVGPLAGGGITRNFVSRNVNVPFRADNSKGKRELGMSSRPFVNRAKPGKVTTFEAIAAASMKAATRFGAEMFDVWVRFG